MWLQQVNKIFYVFKFPQIFNRAVHILSSDNDNHGIPQEGGGRFY